MAYELKLEHFSGPIEKLLELIEEKKLEITQLSLAQVTADFLIYLTTVEKMAPGILADFLVVASRLLLIKSKALLPNLVLDQEEEQEIRDLEERLKIYQEFKIARDHIKNLWQDQPVIFSREFLASSGITCLPAGRSFYPPRKIKPENLETALNRLLQELQKFIYETKDFKLEVINLEEKMREFLKRLEIAQTFNFGKLINSQPKAEIITCFLMILHLIKDHLISVQQEKHFSEITIEKI
ncbi:MAG: segregation/condensation protein A [bacterium]|nr:segregation/condensation protein A [bacterium]